MKENNVDLSQPGTYTVKYSVIDGLGHENIFVRKVKVVKETQKPSIDVEPDNTPDNTTNTIQGQVQTSDNINMTPYVIMLGMSLLGILYVFKKRKSYRKII